MRECTKLLAGKIEVARGLADAHRILWGAALRQLESQRNLLLRDMGFWLDDRLKRPGLTRKQQQMASEIIRELGGNLVLEGMENMRDLHDVHSNETLAQQEKASAGKTHTFLEEILGEALNSDQEFTKPKDILHASIEPIRQQAAASTFCITVRLANSSPDR